MQQSGFLVKYCTATLGKVLGGHLGCVQIPNMVEVLLQSELVLVPAEGECMGEQLPITWSLLVTSHHIHGAGLSGMADNSGHLAPAPDILGWAGHLTGSFTCLVNGGRGWDMALYCYCFISQHLLHTLYGFPYCHCHGRQMFEVILFW